jgi:dihydroorotate dehydrogenase (NAD+) catalytic subunit
MDLCGIELEGPVLNGSGTFDAIAARRAFGDALLEEFPFHGFVSKTITVEPREGNPPPRLWETPAGMINSIGLPNKGLEGFLATDLPELAELPVPLVVSVMGFSRHELATLVARVGEREEVAAIELNVSCPNVAEPAASVNEIAAAARSATSKKLYAKLSPASGDIAAVARVAAEAGVNGLSLVNTIRGLALDARTLAPILSTATGGLSGPALRPVALAAVYACVKATGLPIVGMGGVETGRHALELIAAGASACALGTVLFSDPAAPARIRVELAAEAEALGFDDPFDAHAVAHGDEAPVPLRHVA